jgi:hypothetical protein
MNSINCDFSLRHYFEILDHAVSKYKIGPLKEFEKLRKEEKFVILRHDVDFSLEQALLLAKKENERGIRATYFILLQGMHYNALSKENIKIIKKIFNFGHEIGLHYDSNFTRSKLSFNLRIKKLTEILENIIGEKIISVAQDNPSISQGVNARDSPEYFDAMNPNLLKNTTYFSDSGQNWRRGCACNHINRYNNLYILTHPIWWSEQPTSRENALLNFIKYDMVKTLKRHKKIQDDLHAYIKGINDGTIE